MHLIGVPDANLQVDLANADIRPLAGLATRRTPLPLTLHSRMALTGSTARLTGLKATLAGTELRGALSLDFAARPKVAGRLEADTLDVGPLIAAVIGAPETNARGVTGWSPEPYGPVQFADVEGRIALTVMQAALTPSLPARRLQTVIVLDGSQFALDDFEAHVADGRLSGRLAVRHGPEGLALNAHVDLAKLDAAAVLPSEPRPAIGGRLSARLDLAASGLTPKALVGSLAGTGSVSLEDGYFSNLNPIVFDAIVRASDQGLAVGTSKIRDIVSAALDSGRLGIPRIETTLTVNAGQVRPANTLAHAGGAELAASGTFDLIQQQMDVRLTLTGPPPSDGSSGRPDIFIGLKGPVPTPHRTIDVSALSGWLTIRRIDQQAKKLEALEAAAREQEAERARAAAAPPARPATPVQSPSILAAPAEAPSPTPPASATVTPERRPAVEPKPVVRPPPAVAKPPEARPPAAKSSTVRPVRPTAPAAQPEAPRQSATPAVAVQVPAAAAPSASAGSPASAALPALGVPPLPALTVQEEAKTEQPPPLPAPLEIRSVPRGPERDRSLGSAIEAAPNEPLRLPSAQPSVMDSLIGPGR
jgi:large subunit ribosomal protein L24